VERGLPSSRQKSLPDSRSEARHDCDDALPPSASVPAPLLVLLQIHRHLGGKALSLNLREAFETEREEELTVEAEVRLAESVVAPRLPKARPTFLIEKREPDLVRVERIQRLDFEKPA
jgi:hypothetical protein